jgi:hypothetical protein
MDGIDPDAAPFATFAKKSEEGVGGGSGDSGTDKNGGKGEKVEKYKKSKRYKRYKRYKRSERYKRYRKCWKGNRNSVDEGGDVSIRQGEQEFDDYWRDHHCNHQHDHGRGIAHHQHNVAEPTDAGTVKDEAEMESVPVPGAVTLSWTPPTENEDGSALTDLAGYWIYWRDTSGSDTRSMKIDNPGLSTIVIDNLTAGTYEFAMTSFNVGGVESARSNTITRIVETGAGADEGESELAAATSDATPFLVIAGTPPEAVTAGALYLFTPSVESSGESQPTFAIDGLPLWAGFNEINGELYGAPAEEDIGFYDAITISATDGVVETSLPTFSIEVVAQGAALGAVTLSWEPPTENEDGSYLDDLTGYWIYWGNNSGQYTEWMRIDNPGLTAIVIEDLVPGAWEFAMTSFNADGVESSLSNAVTRFVE